MCIQGIAASCICYYQTGGISSRIIITDIGRVSSRVAIGSATFKCPMPGCRVLGNRCLICHTHALAKSSLRQGYGFYYRGAKINLYGIYELAAWTGSGNHIQPWKCCNDLMRSISGTPKHLRSEERRVG